MGIDRAAQSASGRSELHAAKCGGCDKIFLPARRRCPECRVETVPALVTAQGILITYTTLYVTSEGFDPPLCFGICELDSGHRLFGRISESEIPLKTGLSVNIREDKHGYEFVIVGKNHNG